MSHESQDSNNLLGFVVWFGFLEHRKLEIFRKKLFPCFQSKPFAFSARKKKSQQPGSAPGPRKVWGPVVLLECVHQLVQTNIHQKYKRSLVQQLTTARVSRSILSLQMLASCFWGSKTFPLPIHLPKGQAMAVSLKNSPDFNRPVTLQIGMEAPVASRLAGSLPKMERSEMMWRSKATKCFFHVFS